MSRRIVKVQYRVKGTGRSATITLPLDIYDSWGRPALVSIEEAGGAVIVRPVLLISYTNLEPAAGPRDHGSAERLERSAHRESEVSIAGLRRLLREHETEYGAPLIALLVLGPPTRIIVEYERATLAYRISETLDWVPEQAYEALIEELAGQSPDKTLKDYPQKPTKILAKKAGPFLIIEPFY